MSSTRLPAALRPHRVIAALLVSAALAPRAAADGGEVVTALDPHMRVVFQAKDGAHWFGSAGQGIYRFDGKSLVRFKQEHGLGGSHVWDIQEDRSGNLYVCCYPGGVSRFDGHTFRTLPVADPSKSEWRLEPDDLWFPGEQDSGTVFRYDGKDLHRLALPRSRRGEAMIAKSPRAQYPNIKYLPYDVYTVFKDSRGSVWFGTASLGACRWDGKSLAWANENAVGQGEHDAFGMRSIIEDRDGRFWFSNTLGRYAVLPTPPVVVDARGSLALPLRREPGVGDEASPFSAFMAAVKDKNGDLLLATLGAGVWRYDGVRMARYPVRHGDSDIWVFSIYRDREDTLWLGTQEHGIYRFNGRTFEPFKP